MSLESLRILRGLLLRSFVLGVVATLFFALATRIGWHLWISLIVEDWRLVDQRTFGILVAAWFLLVRFVLVFALLVPGVAAHWTYRREEAKARAQRPQA